MKRFIKQHYYWLIALVVLVELTVYGGILNNFSLYLLPISEALHLSRSSVSLVFSLRSLGSFFSNLLLGILLRKFGYRKASFFGLLGVSASLLVYGASPNMLVLCAASTALGLCESVCFTGGSARIVSSWFHRHQGVILGLVSAATGIGGSLFCVIFADIIAASGWRSSLYFSGAMTLVLAVIMVVTIRNHPRELGLAPYGEGHLPKRKERPSHSHWPGYSMAELKKMPAFYLMMAGTFLSCLGTYVASTSLVAYLQDCGLDASTAASVQSVSFFSLAVVKLLLGYLSDHIGPKRITILCLVFGMAGLFLLARVTTPSSAYIAALIISFGYPVSTIIAPLLSPALFGYRSAGSATGIFLAMVSLAGVLTGPIANALQGVLGSYKPVFYGAAILVMAVIGLYLVLFAMTDRQRKRDYQTHLAYETE